MGFFRPFFTGTYLANTSVLVLFLRNVKHAVRFKHGIELILSVFKRFFFGYEVYYWGMGGIGVFYLNF